MKNLDKNTFGDINEFKSLKFINNYIENCNNPKKIISFLNRFNDICKDISTSNLKHKAYLYQLLRLEYQIKIINLNSYHDIDLITHIQCFIASKLNYLTKNI